jgi:SAM-dependent methyltransferase
VRSRSGSNPVSSSELTEHARRNREHWDAKADEYQAAHGAFIGRPEPRWGVWQIPERELGILGDVAGKDVLELGCGAAQWSILLAQAGARPVGLDNSERQLEHARRLMRDAAADFPLVHASAEAVPLADESFDVVFCDHGAMSFADPYRTVPEAARLLRRGGILAFSHASPFWWLCWNEPADDVDATLHRDYFALYREDEPDGSVGFQLPYGEWIRLFAEHRFAVEALVEPRPDADAETTYGWNREWARRWPAECIWRVRKR